MLEFSQLPESDYQKLLKQRQQHLKQFSWRKSARIILRQLKQIAEEAHDCPIIIGIDPGYDRLVGSGSLAPTVGRFLTKAVLSLIAKAKLRNVINKL